MSDRFIAACDGACKGNPGPAAWAYVVADAQGVPQRWEAGPLGRATNNVAELTALQRLLEVTDPAVPLEVRMDSQYAMNAVTKWLPGWKRNGWRTAAGKPVANQELVVRIDALLTGREVDFVYVAAHRVDGDPLNALADQAASDAATAQRAAGTVHGDADLPVVDLRAAVRPSASKPAKASKPSRPAAAKRSSSGAVIKAKFAGRCHQCGESYAAKDPIAKGPRGWGHPDCRTGLAPA
ncbi:ribonuclease H [Streptomyces sp. NPDC049585]|uniref:ribonuclease H family protein n=1 Tax=Streptomyces sp. NPDC049585 TaxID=3155154 RepID=UPI0034262DA8